ncbi:hypothetical protein BGZ76_007056 [Entomortierella beljakovae]|nr:hypothetical protein BGZ76_007056 [Entomortierella beljakovae]
MYLDMMPQYLYSENVAEYNTKWRAYASGVTILFCCNASGNDMVEPLILVRESSKQWMANYKDAAIPDIGIDDINTKTMWDWLKDFDNKIQRKVILLIDQNMWKQFDLEKVVNKTHLRYVELLCIPQGFSPYLPMKQGIIGDFKKYYHILQLENSSKLLKTFNSVNIATSYTHQYEGSEPAKPISREVFKEFHTLLSQLSSIPYAWMHISGNAIEKYYRIFLQKLVGMTLGDFPRRTRQHSSESAPEKILREKLEVVFPDLPKAVYQYYQNMDNDIGSTKFLREKISNMRNNDDFSGCFGTTLYFGSVHYGGRRLHSNERFADVTRRMLMDPYYTSRHIFPRNPSSTATRSLTV